MREQRFLQVLSLIVVSLAIFVLIRVIGQRMKLPFGHGLPHFEAKLSYKKAAWTRNGIALAVFLIIVLIPSMFVALPAFQAISNRHNLYGCVFRFRGLGKFLAES